MAVGDFLSTRCDGIRCGRVPMLPHCQKGPLTAPALQMVVSQWEPIHTSPHGCWLAEPSRCGCSSGCPCLGLTAAQAVLLLHPSWWGWTSSEARAMWFGWSFQTQPLSTACQRHRVTSAHLYLLGCCLRSSGLRACLNGIHQAATTPRRPGSQQMLSPYLLAV